VLHVGDGLGVVTHDLHFAVRPEIKEHLVIRLTIGWPWKIYGPNDCISWGGVKTERVFPGLSVLRKNNKMEVLYPEK
jgi:hypothetical protein